MIFSINYSSLFISSFCKQADSQTAGPRLYCFGCFGSEFRDHFNCSVLICLYTFHHPANNHIIIFRKGSVMATFLSAYRRMHLRLTSKRRLFGISGSRLLLAWIKVYLWWATTTNRPYYICFDYWVGG